MAFAYFSKDSEGHVHRVAEDEDSKSIINCKEEDYIVISISDDLFQNVIKSKKWIRYENNAVVEENIDFPDGYENSDILKKDLTIKYKSIVPWTWNNQNHPKYNDIKNYCNLIKDFDTTTLTFPMMQTWEEYCESNSITFFHPLQT